ncbi:MAG: SusD/RagB family nutrient-binding outer membrane lipoprotein [Cytophagales bacterium]|nr:SusD/RagB family nutrient-binding outer membrane lipoprotein [Cytophagales bacterium]
MKINKVLRYILIAPLLAGVGCNDFLDVNRTPNNPTSVTPSVLLPAAEAGTAFANANELNRFTAVLMNYLAGAAGSPADYDVYDTDGADFGNQWRFEIYGGSLISYQKMITAADQINAKAYTGIGKIMKAYTFSIATDVWGDVPYSQALQGDAATAVTQPRIDSQEDIYKGNEALGIQSLFDLVREGLADLDATTTTKPTTDDIIYNGVMDNWKRAGNTMLLKFALQISRREPQLATAVMNEVIARNSFIATNAQNLSVEFGAVVGSQSPIHTYTNVSLFKDDLIVSGRYVSRLQGLNDPRLPLFVTKPGANYVTIDNGFRGTLPQPTANWSRWNTAITGVEGVGPVRLITNAQRAFIFAEAKLFLPGVNLPLTAQEYYQEGIQASMEEAGVGDDEITAYFTANPNVVTLAGTPEQQLEQIIEQKYIALTGNGLEAWNDWRRTGYPRLPESQNARGIGGTRPVRAQYINEEIARNPNFEIRQVNERVWWDVD